MPPGRHVVERAFQRVKQRGFAGFVQDVQHEAITAGVRELGRATPIGLVSVPHQGASCLCRQIST